MKTKLLLLFFWVLLLLDITGNSSGIVELHYIAKPLLVPSLMYMFWSETKQLNHSPAKLLFAGLLFSWLGDVLLMFENRHPLFFIFGLISFLITHVLYILYFIKTPAERDSFFRKRPVMLFPAIVYSIELLYILFPYLGALKIPVVVYSFVLTVMWMAAGWQYQKIEFGASLLFICGATCFVISDSLLAINKFYEAVPSSAVWIMLTYGVAQYLIVMGGRRIDQTIRAGI